MNLISTTALAERNGIDVKQLFKILSDNNWIYNKDGKWHLKKEGQVAGGEVKYNPNYGEYVVWPEDLDYKHKVNFEERLTPTKIGEHFSTTNRRINLYFSELGWQEKSRGGWICTKEGKSNGAIQLEAQNGKPYVSWDKSILINSHFLREIQEASGQETTDILDQEILNNDDFRKKFPAKLRTPDGHYVRSRAEILIDDFLYKHGIVHAYERKLNIDETVYCDFYIPSKKIYIEYWGLEENQNYLKRKKEKQGIYSKYNFNLIELNDADIENLDEIFATKLRKFEILID